jgi:hypothetical protein
MRLSGQKWLERRMDSAVVVRERKGTLTAEAQSTRRFAEKNLRELCATPRTLRLCGERPCRNTYALLQPFLPEEPRGQGEKHIESLF